MESVSVRELRQHLSRYLQRVAVGERLVVTDRRRPVAMLGPLPEDDDLLDYLIATDQASAPVGDLLDLPAPQPAEGPSSAEILDELRADRI
jgi:prevent-host-death family protein